MLLDCVHCTVPDIDAKFSKISTSLKRRAAKTLPELFDVIEKSTQDKMVCCSIPCVYDIREWLSPCINDIHNHSHPHVYRYQYLLPLFTTVLKPMTIMLKLALI